MTRYGGSTEPRGNFRRTKRSCSTVKTLSAGGERNGVTTDVTVGFSANPNSEQGRFHYMVWYLLLRQVAEECFSVIFIEELTMSLQCPNNVASFCEFGALLTMARL
jgi:hypothetical protein